MRSDCCHYSSEIEQRTVPVRIVGAPKLTYKICVLGDAGCGKTTLVHRLITGELLQNSQPTSGTGYNTYQVRDGEKQIQCQVWDTAGQERFESLVPTYIRGTDLCLIAVSLNEDAESLSKSLAKWRATLEATCSTARMIVVGTKCDLPVTKISITHVATSALTNAGMDRLQDAIREAITQLASDL